MSKSIPEKSLVVVADGHQAILLHSMGAGDALSLSEDRRLTPKNLSDEGPSGARPEEQTPRQTDEATFAKQLADNLFTMRDAGAYTHLVLVADPQTLGQLRGSLHKSVEESLVLTINKELTNHPIAEIVKIIRNAAGED